MLSNERRLGAGRVTRMLVSPSSVALGALPDTFSGIEPDGDLSRNRPCAGLADVAFLG